MGNFVFELSGFKKETGEYEKKIGKKRGTREEAKQGMSQQETEFRATHDAVCLVGPIDILDEKFFEAIK